MSLRTRAADPVPAFVRVNLRELRFARVKSIFPRVSVAKIVFPESYACCNVTLFTFALQTAI